MLREAGEPLPIRVIGSRALAAKGCRTPDRRVYEMTRLRLQQLFIRLDGRDYDEAGEGDAEGVGYVDATRDSARGHICRQSQGQILNVRKKKSSGQDSKFYSCEPIWPGYQSFHMEARNMSRMLPTVMVVLNQDERQILMGPWAGAGGFQGLAPKLQVKLSPNGELHLFDEEIGSIIRHMSYAQSGFRDRVRKVFRRSIAELMNRK